MAIKPLTLSSTVSFCSEQYKQQFQIRSVSKTNHLTNRISFLGQPQESGFIISYEGSPITERRYMTLWSNTQRNLKELGFTTRFTAHQLRHTYATIAANSGTIPLKVLQGMMGHANFQTTMNTYADFDQDKIIESSRKLSTKFAVSAQKVAEKLQ
jgi:integrase